ncbi:uncharacterized protein [Dendropsophus ebraccatus]
MASPEPKRRRKSKHAVCSSCQQPLPDAWEQSTCSLCLPPAQPPQTDSGEFLSWFKEQLMDTFREVRSAVSQPAHHRAPAAAEHRRHSGQEGGSDSDDVSSQSDTDEEEVYLLHKDRIPRLIHSVKEVLESDKDISHKPKKQQLFYFPVCKNKFLPVHPIMKDWMQKDWSKPEKRFDPGAKFKSIYKLNPEFMADWDLPPKVDLPVAKLSKKSVYPSEESTLLPDAMDRKADFMLKRSFSAASCSAKVASASIPAARALRVMLSQLSSDLENNVSREEMFESVSSMKTVADFLCDASMDSLKFASKNMAVSNVARRALWLKQWDGDLPSKNNFCSLPFHPSSLFGPQLKDILKSLNEDKGVAFPRAAKPKPTRKFQGRYKRSPKRQRFFRQPARLDRFKNKQQTNSGKKKPYNSKGSDL